jgi:hypothetical protein
MRFKLGGYTDTDGNGVKLPLAAQLTETRTKPARGSSSTALTEADLYIAGRLTDQIGGYVKTEADHTSGDGYQIRLSNLDLRFVAKELKLGDKDFLLGVSVNNNPGFDDPVDVLPAAVSLGPPGGSGPTGTFLNLSSANAPANRLIGATVYGLYDANWYGEVGTYRSLEPSTQDDLGYEASGDLGKLNDTAYMRLAYMKDLKQHFFSIGLVGLTTDRQLPRTAQADHLTDLGYDLSYQFLGNHENILQLSFVDIMERRRYGEALLAQRLLAPSHGVLHDRTLSATYVFKQAYGLQVAHMQSTATIDPIRFPPYGKPDTTTDLISLFWTPFGREDSFTSIANLKIAATWFRFTRFNGVTENIFGVPIDVAPTRPGDLNAFTLSASVAF